MTDHQYPKGAIQTEAAFREILAAVWPYSEDKPSVTVFYVHGLGSQSWTTEYVIDRNAEIRENHVGLFVETNAFNNRESRSFSLGDCNIGAHHNHHYLFADADDAAAYLEYAKANTPDIRSSSWFDDIGWDYDRYDD